MGCFSGGSNKGSNRDLWVFQRFAYKGVQVFVRFWDFGVRGQGGESHFLFS